MTQEPSDSEDATCYGRRYPDLAFFFCGRECNVQLLHQHFQDYGRQEGRRFGCEAAPLTAAETAKWCGRPPDVRDCRPGDVAARLHTECAGWNEKDPLKRFTDEHRLRVLDEVIDRGVHICTKQGSDEVIRAVSRRRRLLGLS